MVKCESRSCIGSPYWYLTAHPELLLLEVPISIYQEHYFKNVHVAAVVNNKYDVFLFVFSVRNEKLVIHSYVVVIDVVLSGSRLS